MGNQKDQLRNRPIRESVVAVKNVDAHVDTWDALGYINDTLIPLVKRLAEERFSGCTITGHTDTVNTNGELRSVVTFEISQDAEHEDSTIGEIKDFVIDRLFQITRPIENISGLIVVTDSPNAEYRNPISFLVNLPISTNSNN